MGKVVSTKDVYSKPIIEAFMWECISKDEIEHVRRLKYQKLKMWNKCTSNCYVFSSRLK
jgi:hypothetical protein